MYTLAIELPAGWTLPAGRWQLIEIGHALQAILSLAMQIVVRGIGRIEMMRLTAIRADRFNAEPEHIACIDQIPHRLRRRAGRVRAIFAQIDVVGFRALRPIRAQEEPRARGHRAVLLFPSFDVRHLELEVRIRSSFLGAIDHTYRCDQIFRRHGIDAVAGEIAARDPMDRCIEMRAGMFVHGDVVPIPARAAGVVTRDSLHPEWCALAEFRRQHQSWKIRRQGLRQIHNANAAGGKPREQRRQIGVL